MAKPQRTDIHFDSIEEGIAYAERLVQLENNHKIQMQGKWTLGEVFIHLEKAILMSVHGPKRPAPAVIRMGAKLRKKAMLNKGLPAGIPLNNDIADLSPEPVTPHEGLNRLKAAAAQYTATNDYQEHPIFGKLTDNELNQFHTRHMELHLSHAKILDNA